MTNQIFNQNNFLNLEDQSFGLDFFTNPDSIILAKDPGNLINNFFIELERSLTQQNLINSWYLSDQQQTYNKTQTADNGLCSLFYYLSDNTKYQLIFDQYKNLISNNFTSGQDSQVADWYNLINGNKGATQSRSCAYLLYALTIHQFLDNFTLNRNLALFIAEQLIDLKSENSFLIKDNYNTTQCTLETNVISYFALKLLIPYTDNSDIPDFVEGLKGDIQTKLGIKDNTTSIDLITPKSCIFAGLFALSLGDLTYLNNCLQNLSTFHVYDNERLIGIGINDFDFIYTILASILYYRSNKKSYTYGFLSSLNEIYNATKDFEFINDTKASPIENILWLLILGLIIDSNNFKAEQLFR